MGQNSFRGRILVTHCCVKHLYRLGEKLCNFCIQAFPNDNKAKYFKKEIPSDFKGLYLSWKNHPQKLLRKTQIHFFSLTAWAAQTAQTEEFMFQNVAYRPTVYKTGVLT